MKTYSYKQVETAKSLVNSISGLNKERPNKHDKEHETADTVQKPEL